MPVGPLKDAVVAAPSALPAFVFQPPPESRETEAASGTCDGDTDVWGDAVTVAVCDRVWCGDALGLADGCAAERSRLLNVSTKYSTPVPAAGFAGLNDRPTTLPTAALVPWPSDP